MITYVPGARDKACERDGNKSAEARRIRARSNPRFPWQSAVIPQTDSRMRRYMDSKK